jgi:hypothetical protein
VVADFDDAENGDCDRRKARGGKHRSRGSGNLAPGILQRLCRRGALGAVDEARLARIKRLHVRRKHGRAAIDRRIDETEILERLTPRMDQAGALAHPGAAFPSRLRHHPFLCGSGVPLDALGETQFDAARTVTAAAITS